MFSSDGSWSSLFSSIRPRGRLDLSLVTFKSLLNVSAAQIFTTKWKAYILKKQLLMEGNLSFIPSATGHVWPWRCSPCALTAEQQGGAGLDSPAGRSAPSLCTAGSPQAQCPGLVYRNTDRRSVSAWVPCKSYRCSQFAIMSSLQHTMSLTYFIWEWHPQKISRD